MKATTKYDKHIVALKETLRPITEKQADWFKDKTQWDYGTKHYNSIICLECNHQWKGDFVKARKTVQCPSCKKRIRQTGYNSFCYLDSHGILFDRVGKIQVMRVIFIRKHLNKFQPPVYEIDEVMSKWFDPEAKKVTLLSKSKTSAMGPNFSNWNLKSKLSLKKPHRGLLNNYSSTINTNVYYPNKRIPKEIKRLGFTTKNIYNISHDHLLQGLVTNPRIETLVKKKLYVLAKKELYHTMTEIEWYAIKMCWKKGVEIKSHSDYFDYLRLLSYFGKDTKSPRWICPPDLHLAHQRLVQRKALIVRAERIEQQRIDTIKQIGRAKVFEFEYKQRTKKYFKLLFESKGITIAVIKTVNGFMIAGDELKHCIFVNRYYERKESLIFIAKLKGVLIETIEVNLNTMEIEQARGYDNLPSEYNAKIIDIVKKNMQKIINIHQKAA